MSKKKTDPRLDGLLGTIVGTFCPLFTHMEGCGCAESVKWFSPLAVQSYMIQTK